MTPVMWIETAIMAAIYPPFMFTNTPIIIKAFVTVTTAWAIGYAAWHIWKKRKGK